MHLEGSIRCRMIKGFAAKRKAPLPAVAGNGRRKPTCGGIRQRPGTRAVAREAGRTAVLARARPLGPIEADRPRRFSWIPYNWHLHGIFEGPPICPARGRASHRSDHRFGLVPDFLGGVPVDA